MIKVSVRKAKTFYTMIAKNKTRYNQDVSGFNFLFLQGSETLDEQKKVKGKKGYG